MSSPSESPTSVNSNHTSPLIPSPSTPFFHKERDSADLSHVLDKLPVREPSETDNNNPVIERSYSGSFDGLSEDEVASEDSISDGEPNLSTNINIELHSSPHIITNNTSPPPTKELLSPISSSSPHHSLKEITESVVIDDEFIEENDEIIIETGKSTPAFENNNNKQFPIETSNLIDNSDSNDLNNLENQIDYSLDDKSETSQLTFQDSVKNKDQKSPTNSDYLIDSDFLIDEDLTHRSLKVRSTPASRHQSRDFDLNVADILSPSSKLKKKAPRNQSFTPITSSSYSITTSSKSRVKNVETNQIPWNNRTIPQSLHYDSLMDPHNRWARSKCCRHVIKTTRLPSMDVAEKKMLNLRLGSIEKDELALNFDRLFQIYGTSEPYTPVVLSKCGDDVMSTFDRLKGHLRLLWIDLLVPIEYQDLNSRFELDSEISLRNIRIVAAEIQKLELSKKHVVSILQMIASKQSKSTIYKAVTTLRQSFCPWLSSFLVNNVDYALAPEVTLSKPLTTIPQSILNCCRDDKRISIVKLKGRKIVKPFK
ncbi:hypothetical protein RCL1_006046 [Eukaryota sp. TZLM3-RCL]